jgi:proteasome accessory factor C
VATVPVETNGRSRGGDAGIRPERFARLVTLATVLISAGKVGETLLVADVCDQLQLSPQELREDIAVLNVVNFGGGAYVIYAEVTPTGEIHVDPEPYSDTFDRPARLLPIEAKALVAAIDLIGLAQADLRSARDKVVDALGFDPIEEGLHIVSPKVDDDIMHRAEIAIAEHRVLELEYWTQSQDRYSERKVEPYGRINSREGWYIAAWDPERGRLIHFRLDRIKRAKILDEHFEPSKDLDVAADIGGWPRTGRIGGSRSARVKVSKEQARWAREQRPVLTEVRIGRLRTGVATRPAEVALRDAERFSGAVPE